ncbi:MAG: hypothetical protein AAFQ22_08010 [Pseudomonadota bacterium]
MPYRSLNPEKLIGTLERLNQRIHERFPERGIGAVCSELLQLAHAHGERSKVLRKPNYWIWAGQGLTLGLFLSAIVYGVYKYRLPRLEGETLSALEGVEALFNLVILAGAAAWFLLNLEARIRRGKILADLHQLRSIAHVIDMHQLTKDPTSILGQDEAKTPSSPVRDMTDFELVRYLDYCAEMLSLTGKLAALSMNTSQDSVVIATVNEIEELTTNLSRKVWQKIMIQRQGQLLRPPAKPAVERLSNGKPTANENCSPLHPFAVADGDESDTDF